MTALADVGGIPAEPPPELRFRRRVNLRQTMRELRQARELTIALTERDFRARYKQEILGVTWALLTPLVFMVVFTVFFKRIGHVNTGNVPYALFSYVGLLPWTFFSNGFDSAKNSLIMNIALLNKVYCPREVFPLSAIAGVTIDTLIQSVMLVVIFGIYTYMPRPETVFVPILLVVLAMFTVGIGLLSSVLTVYFRDLRRIIPIILQVGLFATPVGYGIDKIPKQWWPLASAVNPLVPIIDSTRRCVLDGLPPRWGLVGIAAIVSVAWLAGGYWLFKRMETGIADVA